MITEIITNITDRYYEGLSSPTTLLYPDKQTLGERTLDDCVLLTQQGFMQKKMSPEAITDVHQHVLNVPRLTLSRKRSGELVAFLEGAIHETDNQARVYQLLGMMVHPDKQGTGLARSLLEGELNKTGSSVLAFHTQSKRMKGLGEKVSRYDPNLALVLFGLLGSQNLLRQGDLVIDKARYGQCLYADRDRFNQIALTGLDIDRGDAMVYAGKVDRNQIYSLMLRLSIGGW